VADVIKSKPSLLLVAGENSCPRLKRLTIPKEYTSIDGIAGVEEKGFH
jgi:hypothetical protein